MNFYNDVTMSNHDLIMNPIISEQLFATNIDYDIGTTECICIYFQNTFKLRFLPQKMVT